MIPTENLDITQILIKIQRFKFAAIVLKSDQENQKPTELLYQMISRVTTVMASYNNSLSMVWVTQNLDTAALKLLDLPISSKTFQ